MRREVRGLLALLGVYFVLALYYNAVTPVLEAPDEHWHIGYAVYLAQGHGLPVLSFERPDLQESHQPPLYYALGAALIWPIDTHDLPDLLTQNPQWGAGGRAEANDNKNFFIHGWPQEKFPYAGAALAVHIVRVLSAVLGLGTLVGTYGVTRALLGERESAAGLALVATGFVAFNPQFVYLSGAVNNDSLVACICALGLWGCVRVAQGAAWPTAWQFGVLGGLGLLAKWSAGPLFPAVWLAFGWRRWRAEGRAFWRGWLYDGVALAVPALVIAGWWYARNQLIYGDPLALSLVVQIFDTRQPTPSWWEAIQELPLYELSFWGRLGWENIPVPAWFDTYVVALDRLALLGLGVLGVRWGLAMRRGARPLTAGTLTALAALSVFGVILLGLFLQWVRTTFPVGRHLFPGLALSGLVLAVGLGTLARLVVAPRWVPRVVACALPVLVAMSVYVPHGLLVPAYYPSAPPTAEALASSTRLDADIGGTARVLGYTLSAPAVRAGDTLTLTLFWEALAPADRHWTVFVHLLGPDGAPLAQRDTLPDFGRISLRFVTPGQRWSEVYTLNVPADAPVPLTARLRVGLYEQGTWVRAPTAEGDGVTLTTVALGARP